MSMNVVDKQDSSSKKEKESKKTELVTREEIPNSPFVVVGTEEADGKMKYFGTIGKYRITEPSNNEREIIEELEEMTWNRIVQVMLILIETQK